jgi:hypothetical protein
VQGVLVGKEDLGAFQEDEDCPISVWAVEAAAVFSMARKPMAAAEESCFLYAAVFAGVPIAFCLQA